MDVRQRRLEMRDDPVELGVVRDLELDRE